ncbi:MULTISPECIES: hypothetical protein [unclassified Streptomyces]|uniref:hypothetical protein n=1 Tax=unclassified Streptomyces TaxID=2593676 RepID=UPI00081B17A6|nr:MULTISPECIES: hypothetical protein [unclassified Streptomyces]SCE35004.1 hypothetical protein GA0115234_108166 [Streptomyces sp. DvalAA-43]
MSTALALVGLNCAVAAITAAGAVYFTRVRMPRPPVGRYELPDVAVMGVVVVAAPLVYLAAPRTAVAVVFGLVLCAALQFTLAPLIGGGRAWSAAGALVAATAGCAFADLPIAVTALTDVLLAVAVVGVANMWAQSGMRSAHAAWFAGMLCCYDLVATGLTSVMDRFATQVMGLPFAPLLAVTQGRPPVALGLGDLLLLVLFPLVALKAFGRAAALLAAGVGLAVSASVSLLFGLGVLTGAFPLLTALGPLIVLQHVLWSRSRSGERTTAEWRAGTPRSVAADAPTDPDPALLLALEPTDVDALRAELSRGDWLAVVDGRAVGSGKSPGQARRDARLRGCESVPVIRQHWAGPAAGETTGDTDTGRLP